MAIPYLGSEEQSFSVGEISQGTSHVGYLDLHLGIAQ
jgi:hypothetical protein